MMGKASSDGGSSAGWALQVVLKEDFGDDGGGAKGGLPGAGVCVSEGCCV